MSRKYNHVHEEVVRNFEVCDDFNSLNKIFVKEIETYMVNTVWAKVQSDKYNKELKKLQNKLKSATDMYESFHTSANLANVDKVNAEIEATKQRYQTARLAKDHRAVIPKSVRELWKIYDGTNSAYEWKCSIISFFASSGMKPSAELVDIIFKSVGWGNDYAITGTKSFLTNVKNGGVGLTTKRTCGDFAKVFCRRLSALMIEKGRIKVNTDLIPDEYLCK